MHCVLVFVILALAWMFSPTSVRPDSMGSTSLDLTEFVRSVGTFVTVSSFTAGANVQAQDDVSGTVSQFDQGNDGATSASADTAIAASSAATVLALTASATSGVNVPGEMPYFASSTGQGGMGEDFGGTGLFEIPDVSNSTPSPGNLPFNATLRGSLTTDGSGVLATSEIIFNLILPDLGAVPISLENPLLIGPNTSLVSPYSNTLTGSVIMARSTRPFLTPSTR
jgi:hypothetical protein